MKGKELKLNDISLNFIIIRIAISFIVGGAIQIWKHKWWISFLIGLVILAFLMIEKLVRTKISRSNIYNSFQVIKKQGIRNWYVNQANALSKILEETKKSRHIDVMLIRGHDWILGDNPLIERILERFDPSFQDPIRLLLLSPKSEYMVQYLDERELNRNQKNEYFQKCSLAKTHLDDLQSRRKLKHNYYDFRPIWKIILTDQKLFLACYHLTKRGRELPIVEYSEGNKYMYYSFSKYFENIWDISQIREFPQMP